MKSSMLSVLSVAVILGASLAGLAAADRKPNFSGVWMTEGPGRQEVWRKQ